MQDLDATPLVIGDLLFFSASYETGALLLRVSKKAVEEVWSGDEILSAARERLTNEPDEELRVAAEEQRKITRLRLMRLVE